MAAQGDGDRDRRARVVPSDCQDAVDRVIWLVFRAGEQVFERSLQSQFERIVSREESCACMFRCERNGDGDYHGKERLVHTWP